jgi:hypothetical protein
LGPFSPQGIFHLIRGTSENLIIKILAELLRSMCSRLFFIIASAEHIAEGEAQLTALLGEEHSRVVRSLVVVVALYGSWLRRRGL